MRITKLALATSVTALAALLAGPQALAQAAPAAAAEPAADGGEIVVTGTYARSLNAATEVKRKAAFQVDSIASTDIGKFPTQNVAEALQLVTGVAITRRAAKAFMSACAGWGRSSRIPCSMAARWQSTK
jgi:outer membrane receptor for ferrienterochelin and colicin